MITVKDLKPGTKVQLSNGTTFVIEEVNSQVVVSSLLNGSKGNYRTETNDAILFFNEENAKVIL